MCGGVCGCCTGALEASYGGAQPAVAPTRSTRRRRRTRWPSGPGPAAPGPGHAGRAHLRRSIRQGLRAYALRSLEGCDPERVRESEKTMMFFELLSFRFDDFFLPRPLTRLETFS